MSTNDRQFVDVHGTRIEARVIPASSGSTTALIFLHEGLGSMSSWRDFPDRVAHATGLRAIVYSRRGYGASGPASLPRPASFMHDEAREALPALLDASDARDAILVGHSDGGSIALLYAATQPPQLRGVVALAPHVFVEDGTVARIATLSAAYESVGLRERLARHHGTQVDDTFRGWTDVWLDLAFKSWNIEPEIGKIRVPILAIQGKQDEYGTLVHVDSIRTHARVPVEVSLLDECGHSPQRSQPEKTLEAISCFVARTDPYPGSAA